MHRRGIYEDRTPPFPVLEGPLSSIGISHVDGRLCITKLYHHRPPHAGVPARRRIGMPVQACLNRALEHDVSSGDREAWTMCFGERAGRIETWQLIAESPKVASFSTEEQYGVPRLARWIVRATSNGCKRAKAVEAVKTTRHSKQKAGVSVGRSCRVNATAKSIVQARGLSFLKLQHGWSAHLSVMRNLRNTAQGAVFNNRRVLQSWGHDPRTCPYLLLRRP